MNSGDSDMQCKSSPRYLVIQLARFGDLLQTKRLLRSLQADGEVHLLVDDSLKSLAHIVYPGIEVHGIAALVIQPKTNRQLFRRGWRELAT